MWVQDPVLGPWLETTMRCLQQATPVWGGYPCPDLERLAIQQSAKDDLSSTSDDEQFRQEQTPTSDNASLSDLLVGKQWQAKSHTLAGQNLVIAFMPNGEFSGQLTGASYTTAAQPVKGKWQVIEPQLFLDYVYNAQVDSGFTMQAIATSAQIQIHITQASAYKLLGVDQFASAWEWDRMG
jgi:hypothetical protein